MKNQRLLPFSNLVRLFASKISPARKNHLSQILYPCLGLRKERHQKSLYALLSYDEEFAKCTPVTVSGHFIHSTAIHLHDYLHFTVGRTEASRS